MLKTRIIPVLTFNGFALVKTKQFSNPRMVGNPVQAARVYNSRGVDELIFVDIYASKQNRKINLKIVKDVIKECFMPVGIGGGIDSLDDINNLLQIGADKVVVKKVALTNPEFIYSAANFFGSQCISVSIDVIKNNNEYFVYNDLGIEYTMNEYIRIVQELGAGEIILNNVDNDGMMNGFDHHLYNIASEISKIPIVYVGGGGDMSHYNNLFEQTDCNAIGSASIFHFTQYTPLDIKNTLKKLGKPVRLL
jgi:cyclase